MASIQPLREASENWMIRGIQEDLVKVFIGNGDIYKDECNSFKIYSVSMQEGLKVGYERAEELDKIIQDLQ